MGEVLFAFESCMPCSGVVPNPRPSHFLPALACRCLFRVFWHRSIGFIRFTYYQEGTCRTTYLSVCQDQELFSLIHGNKGRRTEGECPSMYINSELRQGKHHHGRLFRMFSCRSLGSNLRHSLPFSATSRACATVKIRRVSHSYRGRDAASVPQGGDLSNHGTMSPHPTPSSSPLEHNLNKDKNACAKLSLHQRKHDFQLDEMQQPSRVNNQRENPIQSMHHKSFEFLKEQTQELISDNSSSKRGLTSYQIVNDWLQLLPMLSDRLRHEGTRLADVAVRESLRKYPDPSVLQLALEIIREWTRERDAEKGNSLLDYLDKEYGHLTDPNIVRDISLAYATVITAWANDTTDPDSLQRALHLFERSKTKSLEVHNAVLNAYGNRGMASEATKFLHDMQSRDTVVNPNVISFSIVMKAWTRSQQPDAQVHIDQMFDQLKELYEAQGCPVHLMPNDVTYAIAMTLAPPRRATALLQEMKSMYESTRNELVAPNVSHYIVVMKSWAKAGKPHEAKRLLAELISSYSSGNEKLRPMYEVSAEYSKMVAASNSLAMRTMYSALDTNPLSNSAL